MFILNGSVDGTNYEDAQVSAEQLINMFGLKVDFESRNKQVSFELLEGQKKFDKLNRTTRYQIAKLIRTGFSGLWKGNSIEVQYFKRKVRKRENGVNVINYTPHLMPYSGDVMPFSIDKSHASTDLEPLVFYMLHPKCADSPIGAGESRKYYRINDVVSKASEAVMNKRRFVEIYNMILEGEDEHLLRNKAAAFGISEHRMTLEEVQNALIQKADNDVDSFRMVFEDVKNTFEGMITRAKNHGIIISKATGGGINSFGFNESISSRVYNEPFHVIAQYRVGQNGMAELKAAISKDPDLIGKINNFLQDNDTESAITENVNEDMLSGRAKANAVPPVKSNDQDEFELAAKWILSNKLVEVQDGLAKYKQTDRRSLKIGDVDESTDLSPQLAYLLSQEDSTYVMDDIRKKMN